MAVTVGGVSSLTTVKLACSVKPAVTHTYNGLVPTLKEPTLIINVLGVSAETLPELKTAPSLQPVPLARIIKEPF